MSAQAKPDAGDALERRRQVLELSGWGKPFRLWQPHNLCFWVYIAMTVVGLFHLVSYFSTGASLVPLGLGAGAVATALYGLVFVVFLRLTDHYERQPPTLVVVAFLWGALAATFGIAITANDALFEIYPKLFGQAFGSDWSAALAAPFTEETAKAAGFVLLLGLAPRLIRSPYDGVFVGAFIGLGFQLFEDVLYTVNGSLAAFGADQLNAALPIFALRVATGFFSHTLFTAVFCCGIIYAIGTPVQPRRLGLGIGLMALSMLAHGVWDGAAAIAAAIGVDPLYGMLLGAGLGVVALVAVLVALRVTAPQERGFLRAIMQPEVENSTITAEDLDALCAPRGQRRQFVRESEGRAQRRNARHILRAALDLAHEIARSDGRERPGVEHERSEIVRLRAEGGSPSAGR